VEDRRQPSYRWRTSIAPLLRTVTPETEAVTRLGRSLRAAVRCRPCVVKLKLDLHEIYNRGDDIDHALRGIIAEAIEKKVRLVEIIPGKGSGQLKKRVLRFLDQKEIKPLYDRVEKDSHNFGRVFVHFRPK
jgi:DNA-nicking Smr family endonuclease